MGGKEEYTEPSLLCVFVGADELGWEDMERVSCRAAVCSEWASCSLLILVSQCPLSSQAMPKRRTQPHYIAHRDKACFHEGFHSEVTNRLQDNWEEHML